MKFAHINYEDGAFSLRASAVIIQENNILMHKYDSADEYFVFSGEILFGEDSETAILRIAREQFKQEFSIAKLLYINEELFKYEGGNKQQHYIDFYYLMTPTNLIVHLPPPIEDSHGKANFHWIPIEKLSDETKLSWFLKMDLCPGSTSHSPRHIISK